MKNDLRYSEMILLPTFKERFEYLKLSGAIGRRTFGGSRYLNQQFYKSDEWKIFRRDIIVRDMSCDLAIDDGLHELHSRVIIHHINPITKEDILKRNFDVILNPENVVCVSHKTHEAIHYSDYSLLDSMAVRAPNDQTPWR